MDRIDWLDRAKGIGIILVVIGHIWWRPGPVHDLIYAFHMPLFFLLSGYSGRPRALGDNAARMVWTMAVPYLAFLVSLALWDWAFETWRGHHPYFRDLPDALRRLTIGGSELTGPFTIFWFVPALAAARLAHDAVARRLSGPADWRWLPLVALLLASGLWLGARSDFSPLGLLPVPVAIAYLWMGALWRAGKRADALTMRAAPLALIACVALVLWPLPPFGMKTGDYGWPLLSLPLSVLLTAGVVALSRHLRWNWLALCGRRSMTIMYLHVAIIHYLSVYVPGWVLLPLALGIPLALHIMFLRTYPTRLLFLGQGPSAADREMPGRVRV